MAEPTAADREKAREIGELLKITFSRDTHLSPEYIAEKVLPFLAAVRAETVEKCAKALHAIGDEFNENERDADYAAVYYEAESVVRDFANPGDTNV